MKKVLRFKEEQFNCIWGSVYMFVAMQWKEILLFCFFCQIKGICAVDIMTILLVEAAFKHEIN